MKTFQQLTSTALTAIQNHVPRATFLAALAPAERSNAALQFDRALDHEFLVANPPTPGKIATESENIARTDRMVDFCANSRHGNTLLRCIATGRRMNPAVSALNVAADEYSEQFTAEETAAARPRAIENLNMDRAFLAARLGIAA